MIAMFYALILLLVAVLITSNYIVLPNEVFAASPSFTDREITDKPRDWLDLKTRNSTKDADFSTDILAVDYYSNGKILNATYWLSAPFKEKPSDSEVNYGMYIDADFNDDTGFNGIDYKVEIKWNNETQNWDKVIESWSQIGKTRVLENISDYTGFYKKDGYYVLLDVNLDELLSPEKYKVLFYSEAKREGSFRTDLTRWVAIPPLELAVFASPSSIELRKGDEKTIEIQVNASQGYEPTVELFTNSPSNDLLLNFKQNNTLRIPSYGLASTPLTITSTDGALVRPYTIFITANSSFPPKELITDYRSRQPIDNVTTQSSLYAVLQEPLSVTDEIADFWNKLGSPISFMYGILAGLSPLLYKKIKEKVKKDKNVHQDDKKQV
jgi:hypothetical protein